MIKFILNYRNPLMITMSDKYLLKSYLKEKGLGKYVVPLLGVYEKAKDIDFSKLPNKFVLKCNHGCSFNIIVKDKSTLDIKNTILQLNKWMSVNHYYHAREWVYKEIERKIICEKYIQDKEKGYLTDYKLSFFHGQCKIINIISGRTSDGKITVTPYTPLFKKIPFHYKNYETDQLEKPAHLQEMLGIGKQLSKGLPFIRVDFYISYDKLYIGELSFFPNAGLATCVPSKYNKVMGDWFTL
ncbi:MAG: glycosyl transferase [Clostridiales bacterium]|nr:glycosyl transferase [Clostridiales bacterium]